MKIALVTDSTSVLTKEEIEANNINVVPIPIIIGKDEFLDGVDITSAKLFQMEKAGADFPKTSQPSMGEMISLFNKLHDDGYEKIICITLSSGISGFFNTLTSITNNNPEYNLHPYDSKMTVKLQGYLALAAAKMIKAGMDVPEIFTELDKIRDSIDEVFVVDDLKNLSRGGRLSNAGAFIGTMLHIKPLLTFNEEGKIIAFDKIRSMKRAVSQIEKLALKRTANLPYKDKLRLFVFHSNDQRQADEIANFIKQNFAGMPVDVAEFSPVIATHLGEKSIAIAWMQDIEKINF